jgi:hypothetical protein
MVRWSAKRSSVEVPWASMDVQGPEEGATGENAAREARTSGRIPHYRQARLLGLRRRQRQCQRRSSRMRRWEKGVCAVHIVDPSQLLVFGGWNPPPCWRRILNSDGTDGKPCASLSPSVPIRTHSSYRQYP